MENDIRIPFPTGRVSQSIPLRFPYLRNSEVTTHYPGLMPASRTLAALDPNAPRGFRRPCGNATAVQPKHPRPRSIPQRPTLPVWSCLDRRASALHEGLCGSSCPPPPPTFRVFVPAGLPPPIIWADCHAHPAPLPPWTLLPPPSACPYQGLRGPACPPPPPPRPRCRGVGRPSFTLYRPLPSLMLASGAQPELPRWSLALPQASPWWYMTKRIHWTMIEFCTPAWPCNCLKSVMRQFSVPAMTCFIGSFIFHRQIESGIAGWIPR